MEKIVLAFSICATLLVLGGVLGLIDRKNFSASWLAVAVLLVLVNDAMLTSLWDAIPALVPGAQWNWQGKLLALAASLTIASLSPFGWKRAGLTLEQHVGSLRPALLALGIYSLFFVAIGLAFDQGTGSLEAIAFQLTAPGIEEEVFYRGILLFALNQALRGRVQFLGVGWGWGAMLSSLVFGLAHAVSYTATDGFGLDPIYLALTATPSLLAVWLRERTGSLLLPIIAHNGGNSIPMLI